MSYAEQLYTDLKQMVADAYHDAEKDKREHLYRVMIAWHMDNKIESICRDLGYRGCLEGKYSGSDVFDRPNPSEFDAGYLDWFDSLVMTLDADQNDLIRGEARHKYKKQAGGGDRRRIDKWMAKFGKGKTTYNARFELARGILIESIENKS